jgi:hypothetical protein
MKLIQHINGVVVDILNVRNDATMESIALVNSIPVFVPKEGYNGILKYGESGLYWDYEAVPSAEDQDIPAEEALDIILGGVTE